MIGQMAFSGTERGDLPGEPYRQAPGAGRVGGRTLPGHSPRASGRVLVAEAEEGDRGLVRRALERHGLEVIECDTGAGALRALFEGRPDLVMLDLDLPDLDGRALLARIRELTDVPVMVVTAGCDESQTVATLRAGADDYVRKPFGIQELLARVDALLRRAPAADAAPGTYVDALIEIDFAALEVRAGGRPIELTPLQLRLLTALVQHAGRVLSAEQLVRLAWRDELVPRERVKLYVAYLRRRFREHGVDIPIETVRGFGYRYRPPPG